jgi:hypothetical protein
VYKDWIQMNVSNGNVRKAEGDFHEIMQSV